MYRILTLSEIEKGDDEVIILSYLKIENGSKQKIYNFLENYVDKVILVEPQSYGYGFYEYGKITSRLYSDGNYWEILGSLPHLYGKSNFCLGTCNFQYSPFIIILADSW